MGRTIIMSLGGSIIIPDEIDVSFLREFKEKIDSKAVKGIKFVIFTGGGRIARKYQDAASQISKIGEEELDWIGIQATKLNAQLLQKIFGKIAEPVILENPHEKILLKKSVLIGSGWLPGCSTDYDAVIAAKNFNSMEIINMSNIDYVYDKDPRKNKNVMPFTSLTWKDYRNLICSRWKAGLNAPFDPVASKEAENLGIKVIIMGKNLKNMDNYIEGKKFNGTVIGG